MYEKRTLPNGVRMVYEHMPHVRSAAIGVWIGVGSRYESPSDAGSAHFIEHMLFKGTAQHTASELAERMDAIGGQVNAYTTREGTCYYARVLDEHLDRAGDLLAEMLFTSNFAEADVANECGVIREEMDMYADTPEDLVTERLIGAAFPGTLGRPVLGRPATIERLTGARSEPGHFVDAHGNVLGTHRGIIHYTIGQRRGLGIAAEAPLYVCGIDVLNNEVVLGRNADLFSTELDASGCNWISGDVPQQPLRVTARIRYRQPEQPCTVTVTGADTVHVSFETPQRAITRGQAVVFYDGDTVLGGGTID